MAIRRKSVDVALVGGGLTAAILGKELAEAGYSVVALKEGRCGRLFLIFSPRQCTTSSNMTSAMDSFRISASRQ